MHLAFEMEMSLAKKMSTKPRKKPVQARSRATVDAILEGAAQVFVTEGYSRGTTDKVAERAGVSIGSLYQYFPNKESLLLALAEIHLEEGFNCIESILSKVLKKTPPALTELLERFVDALVKLHIQNPKLHRVLFNEAPLPAPFIQMKEEREQEFAEKLAMVLPLFPEIRRQDMKVAAYMLVQTTEGLVHSYILYPPNAISPESFKKELVDMLHLYLVGKS